MKDETPIEESIPPYTYTTYRLPQLINTNTSLLGDNPGFIVNMVILISNVDVHIGSHYQPLGSKQHDLKYSVCYLSLKNRHTLYY